MKYCCRCILPDTRPGLRMGPDGICSACVAHDEKRSVDWEARRRQFEDLVASSKRTGRLYDCVIPVSGGKDSTWQVATCLESGLHPLAVTWKPPARTEIGAHNLANLIALGVDHIDYQVNPRVERRFMYKTLAELGSTAVPMHMALFAIPLTVAVRFRIPLVVWGENSADEYGGAGDPSRGYLLDRAWLKGWGVTNGTVAEDWIARGFTEQELTPYFLPSDDELHAANVRAVFLGYFFRWDPATSLAKAMEHGFRPRSAGPKVGYYDFADIDDDFISIHHYLKWYKFGFTRLFDNLSLEIREGRISRGRAVAIVGESGDQLPSDDIERFCDFVDISTAHFFDVIERFRNRNIWVRRDGVWVIENFLIPDWNWR